MFVMKKHHALKRSSKLVVLLHLCVSVCLCLRVQRNPYATDTTSSSKGLTARPWRREGRVHTLLIPLFFSLLNSLLDTHSIYSPFSQLITLCFCSTSNNTTNTTICLELFPLSLYFLNPPPCLPFSLHIILGWWFWASALLSSPVITLS